MKHIVISKELHTRLKIEATKEDKTITELVEAMLTKELARKEEK